MTFLISHTLRLRSCLVHVFVKGMTGKEGVQDLPNGDCIYVVKVPVYYRRFPPGRYIPSDTCRSTWVLVNGSWNCVEREATPLQQALRFDHWVERACFLYHASKASSSPEAGACLSQSPFLALANVPWTPDAVLQFSIASLSTDPALLQSQEVPLNNCHPATLRVINTLLRLVHGGSGGQTVHQFALSVRCKTILRRLDSKGKNPKTNKNYRDEMATRWRHTHPECIMCREHKSLSLVKTHTALSGCRICLIIVGLRSTTRAVRTQKLIPGVSR